MGTAETGTVHTIRARSHLLQLLGEELIGDDRLAVFELVKNSYDADANTVSIEVNVSRRTGQSIVVSDSGTGMSLDVRTLGPLKGTSEIPGREFSGNVEV